MSLLDRYILRTILASVGLVMGVLIALGGLFMFIEQQDDIGVGRYTAGAAFSFVLMNLPQQLYDFLPMAALIGTLVGLGGLARGSELTAMRAAGVSVARIAGSAVIAGLVLIGVAVIIGEYLAPPLQSAAREQKVHRKWATAGFSASGGAWVRDGNLIINVERQTAELSYGGMTVFEFTPDQRLRSIGRAAMATGDSSRRWSLRDYAQSRFDGTTVSARREPAHLLTSNVSAGFIGLAVAEPRHLETRKLVSVLRNLRENGLDTRAHLFALWSRIARTVGIVFACLLAVPFVFGSSRSAGTGARLMLGVMLGVAFYLLQDMVDSSTLAFQLNPVVLAWVPTALLAAVSLALVARTR
ncbi:MAG: LPS export ABC transporter permease LptG [Steroidobacteraceae bacterium]